jgi:cell division protein FtsZ
VVELPREAPVPPAAIEPATILAETNDVTLRPLPPKPTLFVEPMAEARPHAADPAHEAETFIPPAAERAVIRPPRMPRVEDLPMPAQAQIAAARHQEAPAPVVADKKRMTLLQRLAAVGLGRREEEAEEPAREAPPAQAARPAEPRPAPVQPPRPAPEAVRRPPAPQPAPGYRPAAGQLDQHGRPTSPAARAFEDDQLEIPAFLRRHSS